uniref:Uncharacterized protein n=1 Tax=Romanomermis culicivorax TaxID=13658 RepID=A0A915KB58_ROMCU
MASSKILEHGQKRFGAGVEMARAEMAGVEMAAPNCPGPLRTSSIRVSYFLTQQLSFGPCKQVFPAKSPHSITMNLNSTNNRSSLTESQNLKLKDSQGDSIPIDPPPVKRFKENNGKNSRPSSQLLSTFPSICSSLASYPCNNLGIRYPNASFLQEISRNKKRDLTVEEASQIMARCVSEIVDVSKNVRFQTLMISRLTYDDEFEKSGTVNPKIYEKQLHELIRKKFEFRAYYAKNKRGMKQLLAMSQDEP